MIWNKHTNLKGTHAILSGSNYNWSTYSPERLKEYLLALKAKEEGTEIHTIAEELIKHRIKLPIIKKTLNMFVNDAIDLGMEPEVTLYYSPWIYGTADAISFEDGVLRISDLKTGVHQASMQQLKIYTAFFCLEYHVNPRNITMILTIYQNDEMIREQPTAEEIQEIMDFCPICQETINKQQERHKCLTTN